MKLSTIVAGSAAVLFLNGFAFSQQQYQEPFQHGQVFQQDQQNGQISGHDIRQFVGQIERDVNQMVQSRDFSGLRHWTQNHVADHAILSRTNAVSTEGRSRMTSSVTLTKPDLLRLQRFVLSNMAERLNNVEDFRMNIQVMDVEPIGDSAAIVKTRITERATLTGHQDRDNRYSEERDQSERDGDMTVGQGPRAEAEDYEDQRRGHQGGNVRMESQAMCTHLVERRDGGRLQIGMGVCNATTNAQL